jgi:hypothetical protein
MRLHEIEAWALSVIERIETGQRIEDSRIELKAAWIDPVRAARRLAGQANAARGSDILWLIGVDERKGVVGANYEELANWYAEVRAQFDGLAPRLIDLNVPVRDKTVAALLFEVDRVPFVIRNPAFGSPEGGPVEREVPWREGTSVRTARRDDLLRLLSPLTKLPSFEVLDGTLEAKEWKDGNGILVDWELLLTLYVGATTTDVVVIPFHQCTVGLELPGYLGWRPLEDISLGPPTQSFTIQATPSELLIYGPGKVHLTASLRLPKIENLAADAKIAASLLPQGVDMSIAIDVSLVRCVPRPARNVSRWVFSESRDRDATNAAG